MKVLAVFFLAVVTLASSCNTKPETVAVRSLATSKGFIESEMSQHPECQNATTPQLCKLINDAIAGQHVGVLALDTYCSSADYLTNQGPCSPPTQANLKADAQAKLQTAVSNLDAIIANIKTIAGGK